ncbi:MAG: DinB family protein [Actinomycetota bacterium]|nr:DinB family protein [Actinomycetota bacterium]
MPDDAAWESQRRTRGETVDVDRIEIELRLNRTRTSCIEHLRTLSEDELHAPRTRSEHDPSLWWSEADHFVHTTLIERNFNDMIRRHLAGEVAMAGSPVQLDDDLKPATSWDEIMKAVNRFTEEWAVEHRGKPLDELVRLGAQVRGETLQLLSELTDEQLADRIPSAPWANGVVGGILAANADHAEIHHGWGVNGPGPEHATTATPESSA